MRVDFRGKTALVTGSAMGIGSGLSECLARKEANLALADLPEQENALRERAEELSNRYSVKTWVFTVDLTEDDGPERLYQDVTARAGDIDILVNNAGICWYGTFADMPLVRLERMVLLNCLAYAKLARLCLPSMIERDQGAILNVSSISAFQPVPLLAAYAATKAFTQSLSEAIASEVPRRSSVTVSTLNPPFTRTALINDAGVPRDFIPMLTSFLEVDEVAGPGISAFEKGKIRYVPGIYNKVMHLHVVRYLPRPLLAWLLRLLCHRLSDFIPAFMRRAG
ncbi:MAG: SDR family NAD(P)-dependent oxidoreductase [Desulfomonilia bacterium]